MTAVTIRRTLSLPIPFGIGGSGPVAAKEQSVQEVIQSLSTMKAAGEIRGFLIEARCDGTRFITAESPDGGFYVIYDERDNGDAE